MKDETGRELIGYVLDETEETLEITFEKGSDTHRCKMKQPIYDNELGIFVYDIGGVEINGSAESVYIYTITQYWPIRFKINTTSGKSSFILNRITIIGETLNSDDVNLKQID